MAKYRIKCAEITGVKGVSMYKNQVVNETSFVPGSINNLVSTGYIALEPEVAKAADKKVVEVPKDAK